MRFYINFKEEPLDGCANGVCEIRGEDTLIAGVRFRTEKTSFFTFADKWDDKHVTSDQLDRVIDTLIAKYQELL